jgi:hypothetical protein
MFEIYGKNILKDETPKIKSEKIQK